MDPNNPNPTLNGRDHYLKQLNNLSHKISKPIIPKKPNFDHHNRNPPAPHPPQHPPQQPQPRVYNINKNDFRDVVQRLTGSPAHDSFSAPQPIQPPKPPSSRLHRIRPPPLAQLSNRPPPLLNHSQPPPQPLLHPPINNIPPSYAPPMNGFSHRPPPPPPGPVSPYLPSPGFQVAESPVSVYMRYLQNSISSESNTPSPFAGFSPLVSPRWNSMPPPPQQPPQNHQFNHQQPYAPPPPHPAMIPPSPPPQFQIPNSPGMQFGFLNSPKSPYPLLSPSLLLSPYSFPLSPTVPLPSPGWRGFN